MDRTQTFEPQTLVQMLMGIEQYERAMGAVVVFDGGPLDGEQRQVEAECYSLRVAEMVRGNEQAPMMAESTSTEIVKLECGMVTYRWCGRRVFPSFARLYEVDA